MTLSIFLGRFFGLYLLIVGFFYLFRRPFIKKAAEQIFEKEAFVVITAIISLIMGLLVVLSHNIWTFNWKVSITLIGYLALCKGLARLFVPHHIDKKLILKLVIGDNPIYVGIICLIFGFFLLYEGFFSAL